MANMCPDIKLSHKVFGDVLYKTQSDQVRWKKYHYFEANLFRH